MASVKNKQTKVRNKKHQANRPVLSPFVSLAKTRYLPAPRVQFFQLFGYMQARLYRDQLCAGESIDALIAALNHGYLITQYFRDCAKNPALENAKMDLFNQAEIEIGRLYALSMDLKWGVLRPSTQSCALIDTAISLYDDIVARSPNDIAEATRAMTCVRINEMNRAISAVHAYIPFNYFSFGENWHESAAGTLAAA